VSFSLEEKRMATASPAPLRIRGVIECELCNDTGFRQLANDADRVVVRCECVHRERARHLVDAANIPHRYRAATLQNFDHSGPRAGLAFAHLWARRFVESYPVEGERGALLVGSCGTGKTHLAIGIVKELMAKGVAGCFCDYSWLLQELLQEIRREGGSEMEILRPLLEVAVLILDDIGAMRPSAWVLDTVTMLLNERYSRGLTTLLTANYRDKLATSQGNPELTLQERVGERVVSRLREMCRFVPMDGPDYRMNFAA